MGRFGGMWNSKCGMRNEVVGNAERRVLGLVPNNSELRTYNSELGKAGDSELGEAVDSELPHTMGPWVCG
jgi:hypothetical protein